MFSAFSLMPTGGVQPGTQAISFAAPYAAAAPSVSGSCSGYSSAWSSACPSGCQSACQSACPSACVSPTKFQPVFQRGAPPLDCNMHSIQDAANCLFQQQQQQLQQRRNPKEYCKVYILCDEEPQIQSKILEFLSTYPKPFYVSQESGMTNNLIIEFDSRKTAEDTQQIFQNFYPNLQISLVEDIVKDFKNVYVTNLPNESFTEDDLERMFTEFGRIHSRKLLQRPDRLATGFVRFQRYEDARRAVRVINDRKLLSGLATVQCKFANKTLRRQNHGGKIYESQMTGSPGVINAGTPCQQLCFGTGATPDRRSSVVLVPTAAAGPPTPIAGPGATLVCPAIDAFTGAAQQQQIDSMPASQQQGGWVYLAGTPFHVMAPADPHAGTVIAMPSMVDGS